jgi:arginyl-tRNA synthetase
MDNKVLDTLTSTIKEVYGIEVAPQLSVPDGKFGDLSTNIAMQLAGILKKNPHEIAQTIADKLQDNPLYSEVGVAGPGFINLTLAADKLWNRVLEEPQKLLDGTKIVTEYSDPNPFKPLHAGHLYTTIVGDVIARIIEAAGADVVRVNYGGDVGLHVARSMWGIFETLSPGQHNEFSVLEQLRIMEQEKSVHERAKFLGECYVVGTAAHEDGSAEAAVIAINKKVYQLHFENDTESLFAQIYWLCRTWSYEYFVQLYERLQIVPFDRFIPESEVTKTGLEVVQKQLNDGIFSRSEGAVVFEGEKYDLHTRVFVNSDGLPTYETKDVGLSLTKWNDYNFDSSIILTANEQKQYMQVVIKAIEQFAPEPAKRTRHLVHGLVKMTGGVKMSSRKGNTLLAMDMLDAAREAGVKSGTAKNETTVLAAVKYALLKNKMGGDIAYDPEESVAMEGNSGPYLQYAHARARSIIRKTTKNFSGAINKNLEQGGEFTEGERTLIRKLAEFTTVIERATIELAPHYICTYMYELAQEFNRFYENNKVIADKRELVRLELVSRYASTLKQCLDLLGIDAPESM